MPKILDFSEIEPLISEQRLISRVRELGAQIADDYKETAPLFVAVAHGAIPFLVDLLRAIPFSCEYMIIGASSYGSSTKSNGEPEFAFLKDIEKVRGREIVVVEDILETGATLLHLKKLLTENGAVNVKLCILLDKPEAHSADLITPDYTGFSIGNAFVVGYGLDYAESYRNLPYIGILPEKGI